MKMFAAVMIDYNTKLIYDTLHVVASNETFICPL